MSKARLYVLIGASGVGKNELAIQACSRHERFEICKKDSTRPSRVDDTDVEHVPEVDFRSNDETLGYIMNGHTYVVRTGHIKRRLDEGFSQILITSSFTALARLRIIFPDMRVMFVHRDLTEDQLREIMLVRGLRGPDLEMALLKRKIARNVLYNQVAGAMMNPDHVIINTTIESANEQFDNIVAVADSGVLSVGSARAKVPTVNIIITGTGRLKKFGLQAIQTIPGGHQTIIPKYLMREKRPKDGPEARFTGEIPPRCISYTFFGNEYGVDPVEAARVARDHGVGFITISDLHATLELAWQLQGMDVQPRVIYQHQPALELADYPPEEHDERREHAEDLLDYYRRRLVTRLDLTVILSESKGVVCTYFQRLLNEAFV